MDLDSLWPWRGAALGLVAALAWAGLLRLLRRPDLAALGAGIGLAAGVVLTLGGVAASPRQLPERLALLLLGGVALGLLLALAGGEGRRGLLIGLGAGAGVLAGAWWVGGAPLALPDLQRATVTLLGLAVLFAALLPVLTGPWQAAAAAALLLAGLWMTAPVGPWLVLAAVALGAALGAAVAGPAWPVAARLPVALGLGVLIAGPVLARGGAADWTAAAGPVAALWVVPVLVERIPGIGGRILSWIIAGGLPLVFTWLQSRAP